MLLAGGPIAERGLLHVPTGTSVCDAVAPSSPRATSGYRVGGSRDGGGSVAVPDNPVLTPGHCVRGLSIAGAPFVPLIVGGEWQAAARRCDPPFRHGRTFDERRPERALDRGPHSRRLLRELRQSSHHWMCPRPPEPPAVAQRQDSWRTRPPDRPAREVARSVRSSRCLPSAARLTVCPGDYCVKRSSKSRSLAPVESQTSGAVAARLDCARTASRAPRRPER